MSKSKQNLGRWGESRAVAYLKENGYSILARNYRTPHGEIDIVAWKNWVTVFVEVKTRSSKSFAPPEASITPKKQTHILNAAQVYLQNHPEYDKDWRVDVIAIRRLEHREPELVHFENAITG